MFVLVYSVHARLSSYHIVSYSVHIMISLSCHIVISFRSL